MLSEGILNPIFNVLFIMECTAYAFSNNFFKENCLLFIIYFQIIIQILNIVRTVTKISKLLYDNLQYEITIFEMMKVPTNFVIKYLLLYTIYFDTHKVFYFHQLYKKITYSVFYIA